VCRDTRRLTRGYLPNPAKLGGRGIGVMWEHWDLNPGRRVSSVLGWMSGSSLQFFRVTRGIPVSSHPRTPETTPMDLHRNWSP